MKFIKRYINRIQVPITRICNRQCPHCCARETLTWYNKSITEKEVTLEELIWAGKLIGKIDQIEITGGEPTLHSKFEEISNNLSNIFQCNDFMLVSNGWLFKDPYKLPLLLNYQRVWITHYTEEFVKKYGGVINTREFNLVANFLKQYPNIHFIPVHTFEHKAFLDPPYKGNPCGHHLYMPAYYEKYLYGCCVAWSLPYRGKGIPLTEDWRDHLEEIDIPCDQCFLSI